MPTPHSLTVRTLRLAAVRIAIVSVCAGIVSYYINVHSLDAMVRAQLLLSTEQTVQRESLPFREIHEIQRNFLDEFHAVDTDPVRRAGLVGEFDRFFIRHDDGSYTQRPGVFEGEALPDGRRFPGMSATYAPDFPPTDDVKARFALSFLLSSKYGSVTRGRLFNLYGVVPEKGFPIHQAADIAKVFTYSGPDRLALETYEFFERGFSAGAAETFMTRMYFDYSNKAWMTTIATPDGRTPHRVLACVDVLLDDLLTRLAHPAIAGAYSTLFLGDDDGTLMFHSRHMDAIRDSEGRASIRSLGLEDDLPLLVAAKSRSAGTVTLVDTPQAIVAVGRLPGTPAVLAIHYPRELMRPAILQNLLVLAGVGLLTLLVEIFILRALLQGQISVPLSRLIDASRRLGASDGLVERHELPCGAQDEIGDLAREFANMAIRVQQARTDLEAKVRERTIALEEANRQLAVLSATDGLTGLANRRAFDEMLDEEWRRARRSGSTLVAAMIDVDWFKRYNDCYGHPAGDACLRQVADALRSVAQRAGDIVARYGGEEFVVVTIANADSMASFVQSIRAAIERLALPHEESPFGHVTVSVGVACCRPDGTEQPPGALLERADRALYRAKDGGRNRVVLD